MSEQNHESFLELIGMEKNKASLEIFQEQTENDLPEVPFDIDELPPEAEHAATLWEAEEEKLEAALHDDHLQNISEVEVPESSPMLQPFGDVQPAEERTDVYLAEEIPETPEPPSLTDSGEYALPLEELPEEIPEASRSRHTQPIEYADPDSHTVNFEYDQDNAGARLVMLSGKANAKAFHLGHLPLRLGRDSTNEVILDDINASRFHAEVREQSGALVIVDLGSTNGMKVNGLSVQESVLNSHDVVQIGEAVLEFLPTGVLSKGVVQQSAIADSHDPSPMNFSSSKKKKKKIIFLGAIIFVIGIGYFSVVKRHQVADAAKTLLLQKAEYDIQNIRSGLENQLHKQIQDVDSKEVKKIFLDRITSSNLAQIAPPEIFTQLQNLPPIAFKMLLENPSLLTQAVSLGADSSALVSVLKLKLADWIEAKRFEESIELVKFILASEPSNVTLQQTLQNLEAVVAKKESDTGPQSLVDENNDPDEQKFAEYMSVYEKNVSELIKQNRITDAKEFSKLVHDRIELLIQKEPFFKKAGSKELDRWQARILKLEEIETNEKKAADAESAYRQAGEKLYAQIRSHMMVADFAKARAEIQDFAEKYPHHFRFKEVVAFQKEMDTNLSQTFAATKSKIQQFIQTESYAAAWQEVYRFLEVSPEFTEALNLKEDLEKRTEPRAIQFYNEARVYEYEGDDLVAAETYYKRVLEVADPKSDIFAKAQRRFADVHRKSIQ